ncbi:MAG TPA: hypothetical protein VGB44_12440 [Flavobacterium sp.]|jgi:tetratricopeptide (TPR) repeat protein
MKHKILLLVLLCFSAIAAIGQESCDEQVKELNVLTANNQFHEAYAVLSASECVLKNPQAFDAAEKVLIYKVESAANDEEKKKQLEMLLTFFDEFDLRNPSNIKGNKIKKVVALQRFAPGSDDDVFKILDSEFKRDLKNFNDASGIYLYFDLFFKKFKASTKGITENDVFIKHDILQNKLDQLIKANPPLEREYRTAANGISALAKPIFTCEKLTQFYQSGLVSHKNEAEWLARAASGLKTTNCTTSQLFMDVAAHWYDADPSSTSAYNLAIAYSRSKQGAKAKEYYQIAADLEKNPVEKSKIYYTIASTLMGSDKKQSLDNIQKAIAANPNNGKAYLLLAQIYSSAEECGATPLEKKAVYLLASKAAIQAGEKEPSLKAAAQRQSELFLKKGPSIDEIREQNQSGKSITYKCWLNTSVILP